MVRQFLALALTVLLIGSATADEKKPATKLMGLLITGGCCHDYTNQKLIITQGISQRVSISWDIVHEGGTGRMHQVSVYKKKDWAKKYDVIVHNECFGGVKDDEFVKSIAAAHHAGVPAIFIHCSLHSYRAAPNGADAWRELIGVTSRRHEKHRAVAVKNVNAEHPVMTGFPKEWPSPNGELYIIEKVWPNCTPLAQAYGKDTKKDHTIVWLNKFGKAKVFGTSLGHHNATMNNNVWLGLVSRGLLWTVDKLDEKGNPAKGYAGTGIKPIKLPGLVPVADSELKLLPTPQLQSKPKFDRKPKKK
jgi:uncharacterized protein